MNPLPSTEPPTATGGNLQTTVYQSQKKFCALLAVVACTNSLLNSNCNFARFFPQVDTNAYQILEQKQ